MLFEQLHGSVSARAPAHERAAAAGLLSVVCTQSSASEEVATYVATTLQALLELYGAAEPAVVRAGFAALDAVVKATSKERYLLYARPLHESLVGLADAAREDAADVAKLSGASTVAACAAAAVAIPGFALPKGLAPLTTIWLHALMNASSTELRAGAADAIGAAVELTPAAALKPFVIPLTGPLIRIVGDRFPPNVKVAILRALTTLLRKASLALKPFVPQLQSTFVKALADAQSDELRAQGAVALAELAPLSTRVEVLVTDMHGSLSGAVTGVERAYLCALAGVLRKTSKPVSAALLAKVEAAAIERLPSEELGRAAAAAVAACGRWVEDGLPPLLERVEAGVKAAAVADGPWRSDLAELRVHLALLRLQPASTLSPLLPAMLATAVVAAASEESEVRQAAAHALARVASAMAEPEAADVADATSAGEIETLARAVAAGAAPSAFGALACLVGDADGDVRLSALHAIKRLCRLRPVLLRIGPALGALSPAVAAQAADRRRSHLQYAAQRCLVVLLSAAAIDSAERLAAEEHAPKGKDAAAVNDFLAKHFKRIRAMESEGEGSDVDP